MGMQHLTGGSQMARELVWNRIADLSFNWPLGTAGNRNIATINPGETLTRIVMQVRFWAAAVDQTLPSEHSLYVPYWFGVLWGDPRIIPNPALIGLVQAAQQFPDNMLWFEKYTMRDAYTPARHAAVNIGWIDDRPSMNVDVTKQRLNDRPDAPISVQFLWQANSTLLADPLAYTPLATASILRRTANE